MPEARQLEFDVFMGLSNTNPVELNRGITGRNETLPPELEVKPAYSGTPDFPPQPHPNVIAAVPCYNTQNSIAAVVARAKKYVDKVFVIDDGSTDNTAAAAAAAGAVVIAHCCNKGYGEAIKSCFAAARDCGADVLVTIDGDGQHDPGDMPRLLVPILRDKNDLVIGSRFLDNTKTIPGYRKFGIDVINRLWNLGSMVKVTDTQSGYRAYSRALIDSAVFHEKGMGISIEILEKARRSRARLTEVAIFCSYENNNDCMSLKAFLHGLKVSFCVLKIRLKTFFGI